MTCILLFVVGVDAHLEDWTRQQVPYQTKAFCVGIKMRDYNAETPPSAPEGVCPLSPSFASLVVAKFTTETGVRCEQGRHFE